MMFRRKIYDKMLQWKKYDGSRSLLIEGAHFVGKTTVAKEFGKKEYKSCVYIDFKTAGKAVRYYFEEYMEDLDLLFMNLSAAYDTILYRRNTLFIFDNVQEFPRARQSLKHLVADGRYDFMALGFLVSIRKNVKDIVIPSEEWDIEMYPMDFEEFCWALGHEKIVDRIQKSFDSQSCPSKLIHSDAMTLFEQYLLVGGMPQCVEKFLSSGRDLNAVDNEKRGMLEQYRDDIGRITPHYRTKVMGLFDSLPDILSDSQGRIVYKKIVKGTCTRSFGEALSWLAESKMCNLSSNFAERYSPLHSDIKRNYFKCYMADTGLLFSHAFSKSELSKEKAHQHILDGDFFLKNGIFFKNAVSQMLACSERPLYFYTHYDAASHRNDMSADFVITKIVDYEKKIFPITVKTGSTRYIGPMLRLCEKYRDEIGTAYVVSPEEFRVKDGVTYIPPYMVPCILYPSANKR